MTTYYKNPSNGYVEIGTTQYTWLWALLFGVFYFGYKGMWGVALLAALAAAATYGWAWLALPFVAAPLVRKRYQQMGWAETPGPETAVRSRV